MTKAERKWLMGWRECCANTASSILAKCKIRSGKKRACQKCVNLSHYYRNAGRRAARKLSK